MTIRTLLSSALALAAIVAMPGCGGSGQATQKGVVVKTSDGQFVRLQVVNDKIIRVSATLDGVFDKDASLMTVPQNDFTAYETNENDSTFVITTKEVKAVVCKASGNVAFFNIDGTPILREDGRIMRDTTITQSDAKNTKTDKGLTFRQKWVPGEDDAIYGLGQHQAEDFNYRGKNEDLYQYNTKVSIPFFISNKGYGVLWDNNSLSRWGDEREYAQLNEAFKVYDKDGNEGGLSSHWTPDASAGIQALDRTEPILYFADLMSNKANLPKGFPLMGADVDFDGYLEPQETGVYRFLIYYAGYTRVFVDGKELFPEIWRTAWNPNSRKFELNMEKGKRVKLHIDWKPDGGESYCALRALTPVPDEEQDKLALWSEIGSQEDYYFIKGSNMDDVISGYRTLTGKSQVMAKWVMGFWQSRERYRSQEDILATVKYFREHHIPIDNIVQDWNYWADDQWGAHDFETSRYPDPKAMIDSVHAMHARFMISVWPKFYTNTEHYKEFDQNGWMYQRAVTDSLRDWVGPGYTYSFYDAYSAGARNLFWNQMNEHLYKYGIDSWWMDASEPNVRDCTPTQYRKDLCGPTALGTSAKYFNAYSIVNADAIYNGQRSVNDTSRVFLLTRSGFAGLQRYSTASWSGDIASRWEDMRAQIMAGLNYSVAGVPMWGQDIGGFCVEKRHEKAFDIFNKTGKVNDDLKDWRELQARWHQWGVFTPLYRTHGQYPTREIWNIAPEGDPAYNSILYCHKLRYRLMPYIYSLAGAVHFNDYTILRPLVMDFTADTKVNNIGDQFMFGPSIMVAPVTAYGARSREVYLPAGAKWYDFYTGKAQDGGQTVTASAPYERTPVFVPSGAIILTGPDMEWSDEKPADNITVYVYAGRDGEFTLYEDEGTNNNYEKGAAAFIDMKYDDAAKTLTIGQRRGSFNGMLAKRTFNVVLVSDANQAAVDTDANGQSVAYDGSEVTVNL